MFNTTKAFRLKVTGVVPDVRTKPRYTFLYDNILSIESK
jgi:hypothetical protein